MVSHKAVSFPQETKTQNSTSSAAPYKKDGLLLLTDKQQSSTSTSAGSAPYESVYASPPTYTRRTQLENALGSRGVLCGIKNIGATCYAASLLQTMFMTPELRAHVISFPFEERQRHKDNIAYQLQVLFAQMQGKRKAFVDPTNLLLSFNMGPGAHKEQHDVQELNRQLVDVIQGFIDRCPPELKQKQVIQDLYRGEFGDVKKCRGCNAVTFTGGQVYLDLQIPIVNQSSLPGALENYVKPDVIEGARCEHCEGPQTLEKGAVFQSFPKVFSIHLLRFDFNMTTFRREKVESDVELPVELNVNNLLYVPESGEKKKQNESSSAPQSNDDDAAAAATSAPPVAVDNSYEINAVICHRGTTYHGHYYCFVRVRESEEELNKILNPSHQDNSNNNKSAEVLQKEAELRSLVGGTAWVKFDDDRVTIADNDEVLSYIKPGLWKQRKEIIKKQKEESEAAENQKKREEKEKQQNEDKNKNNTTDAAAVEMTEIKPSSSSSSSPSSSEKHVDAAEPIYNHPLAPEKKSVATTAEEFSKKSDEDAIADIFADCAVLPYGDASSYESKTDFSHLTKVSGHSYYVLYRRKDVAPSPLVKVVDVWTNPSVESIPEYVKSMVEKEELELEQKAVELESLKDVVSVAIWDDYNNNNKTAAKSSTTTNRRRTWIDAREDTTIAELTKMAFDKICAPISSLDNNKSSSSTDDQKSKPEQDQQTSEDAAPSSSSSSTHQKVTPIFDPDCFRLRKYSTAHLVGGASFQTPDTTTLASLGYKKSSTQHGNFLFEFRSSNQDPAFAPVTENDLCLRVAKLTKTTPMNVPITEFDKIVVPAGASLLQVYEKAAQLYKIDGGVGNVQLTLRKDGEAVLLSVWEQKEGSVVNMGKKSGSDDGTDSLISLLTMGISPSAAGAVFANAKSESFDNEDAATATTTTASKQQQQQSQPPLTQQEEADAEMAKKLQEEENNKNGNNNNNKNNTEKKNNNNKGVSPHHQEEKRKPFYRDLEKTTVKHLDLCQDDVIFVEEFSQINLPSDPAQLRSHLTAVEFVDYQYLIKVFWSISGYDDLLTATIHSKHDSKVPFFVDKRKTLIDLKEKVCTLLGLIGENTSNQNQNQKNNNVTESSSPLSECQMLLDGAVREPKNLQSTTIRSATYGLGVVNVEIRKGRPLQESECFVTVFKTTSDYLKNPVEQLKRVLIKSDTTLYALAEAALDPNFPNEGACGIETASPSPSSSSGKQNDDAASTDVIILGQAEKSVPQQSGGSTRVTSLFINGQHYRPRLMPAGTNVKSWGSAMMKREVKANLSHQHVTDSSTEIRVVLQPVEKEEALTKSSLLLTFHRWNAMAPDVSSSLALPGKSAVLSKDGAIESILDVFNEFSPEIPTENIEFTHCRAYQMRNQESVCNDLNWLSKSFLDVESGKRRTLCGHPMRLENDEIILYRDSDESWPANVNVQFGFDSIQSNSQAKQIQKDSADNNTTSDSKESALDAAKNKSKNNRPAEKGISLRVMWDEQQPVETKSSKKQDGGSSSSPVGEDAADDADADLARALALSEQQEEGNGSALSEDDVAKIKKMGKNNKNNTGDDDDDNDSTKAHHNDEDHVGKMDDVRDGAEDSSTKSTTAKTQSTTTSSSKKVGSVAASIGVSDDELINFVPHEPYGELMKISLPTQCCVCFCDFEDGEAVCVTKCHHIVHKDCLAPWLAQEFSCPQCKTSLW